MNNKLLRNILIIAILIVTISIIIVVVILSINKEDSDGENINTNNNQIYDVNPQNKKPEEKKESTLIKENEYNTFSVQAVREESLINSFLEDYKENALYYPEDAYNLLDEEYRNKKFGSLEAYEEYVNNNRQEIENIQLDKYMITNQDLNDQYVCIDKNGNYYIITKMSTMEYTVILDTYTVDLPEFLDRYNGADDEYKVGYNVEKFISAINDGDYKYAYNLLDETFRRNNYPSQGDFENFVKANFFENNEIQHNNVEKQGNQFVYGITIINKDNESERKNITVIMELGEETDFVMSFSIDE